jgi:hypothetical protein
MAVASIREWGYWYLGGRFVFATAATKIVDEAIRTTRELDHINDLALETFNHWELTEQVKNAFVANLRQKALAYLEEHEPDAWYLSFFREKPGEQYG